MIRGNHSKGSAPVFFFRYEQFVIDRRRLTLVISHRPSTENQAKRNTRPSNDYDYEGEEEFPGFNDVDTRVKDKDEGDSRAPLHAGYVHGAVPFEDPFKPSRPAPSPVEEEEDEFEDVDFQTSIPNEENNGQEDYRDDYSDDYREVYQPSTADQGSNFEEELKAYLPTFVDTDPLFRRKFPSRRGKS